MAMPAPGTDRRTPTCPECGTEVQSTWRWCLACGYDPDGLREQHERRRPTEAEAAAEADAAKAERRAGAGWMAAVVVVGLLLAGSLYVARTRTSTPADASSGAGQVTTTQPSWGPFRSAEGGFSLLVPAEPTVESYDVPFAGTPRTFHNATAIFGDDSFVISYIDLDPAEASGAPADRLQAFATAYAGVIGGVPRPPTPVTVDGNPAIDYSFDLKGAGLDRSRAILKGNRVYNISVMGPAPRSEDFERMVTTFRFE